MKFVWAPRDPEPGTPEWFKARLDREAERRGLSPFDSSRHPVTFIVECLAKAEARIAELEAKLGRNEEARRAGD